MNTVRLIDCMEFMKGCKDNQYDLAIVDPPYGIKQLSVKEHRDPSSKFRRSMSRMVDSANKWNSEKPTQEYWNELFRITKEQIIWGANNFSLPESEYFCVWDKMQTVDNFASAELAWVSMNEWKKPAKVFRYQIHKCASVDGDKIHPTQKPVALYRWLLQNYAKPGNTIFDSHVGSGSIRIACHDMGFDFEGCEIDPDYHTAQEARFQNHIKQADLFTPTEIFTPNQGNQGTLL
jgi:site-specific DNA-methyltransferase (adenine-specific)